MSEWHTGFSWLGVDADDLIGPPPPKKLRMSGILSTGDASRVYDRHISKTFSSRRRMRKGVEYVFTAHLGSHAGNDTPRDFWLWEGAIMTRRVPSTRNFRHC